jgi:hypothetical protein
MRKRATKMEMRKSDLHKYAGLVKTAVVVVTMIVTKEDAVAPNAEEAATHPVANVEAISPTVKK